MNWDRRCFRIKCMTCSVWNHYLNQNRLNIKYTFRSKLENNVCGQNTWTFIGENSFQMSSANVCHFALLTIGLSTKKDMPVKSQHTSQSMISECVIDRSKMTNATKNRLFYSPTSQIQYYVLVFSQYQNLCHRQTYIRIFGTHGN